MSNPGRRRRRQGPLVADRNRVAVIDAHAEPALLLGPPALIEGEDAAAYYELFAKVSAAVKPRDVIEEILLRDVVDHTWGALRMRRVEAALVADGLTTRALNLRTISANVDAVERIDRIGMNAEVRRNAALREIERHRAGVAAALRRATDDVPDAEFEDVARVPARKHVA